MAEIRFTVDENFINDLKRDAGVEKSTQITTDALNLMRWAINQAQQGRVLITADADGSNPQRIVVPALENVKKK